MSDFKKFKKRNCLSVLLVLGIVFLFGCSPKKATDDRKPASTEETVIPEEQFSKTEDNEAAVPKTEEQQETAVSEETSGSHGGRQQARPPEKLPSVQLPLPQSSPSSVDSAENVSALPEQEPKKKSARMAYNFPAEMHRNKSADINVYVSLVNSESYVKDTLMKIVALQNDPNSGKIKKDSVVTANILLYKRIAVELLDPDSAFIVKQIFGRTWQDVDSTGDNRWRWNLIPQTDKPEAKLIIKVVAETPAGEPKDIDDRTFYIRIRMTGPNQTVRSWVTYLQDHPGLVLTAILIPMLGFFGKRYFERKSKGKNSEKT